MIKRLVISLVLSLLTKSSIADEIRPGYLELKEKNINIFSVILKVPVKGNTKPSINAQLPANCRKNTPVTSQYINSAYIQRWNVKCKNGLVGKIISVKGLEATNTDVLLRMEFLNATSQSILLTPTNHFYLIPAEATPLQIISTYMMLGIEHILLGFDHLLFVFALLLIVNGKRRLLWTITAFTVAHSITLGAATLGFMYVPQQPVEAVIALSILFLAVELMHGKQGRKGAAARWPWLVAFVFGLLHGFGFAGALAEIGLPEQAIPLALVFFNVGVEIGQLIFVVVVFILGWLLKRLKQPRLFEKAEIMAIYSIGGLSSFWLFERISSF